MKFDKSPWVLGINASDHNGSVCLLRGDEIVAAIQEERLTRNKRDPLRMPRPLSVDYCLNYAEISQQDLDLVVVCGVASQASILSQFKEIFPETPLMSLSHHLSHAVGAFATSGFEEAAILVVDGCGSSADDLTSEKLCSVKLAVAPNSSNPQEIISLYQASGTELICLEKHLGSWSRELTFGSLGDLYDTVANVIFGYDATGKVMGLAPYGRAEIPRSRFFDIIDGKFVFHDLGLKLIEKWPANQSLHENLAASTQIAIEEALIYLTKHLKELCPSRNLIFSGGVALNSVANEKIVQEGCFDNTYFMPAAEDSGNAIGAAYYGLWQLTKQNTQQTLLQDSLGREYSQQEISKAIANTPAVKVYQSGEKSIISNVVDKLVEGKIIGWFQGRSELGPRALGQRSILCNPRLPNGKDYLNNKVKHREAFRPFAPAILLEEAKNWFELDGVDPSCPFMMRVCRFREEKRNLVPSVVHFDGTGRVQTLTQERNGKFYELVQAFYKKTGVPILLNTSFNVMHEPIVESPEDALWGLLYTGIDYCVLQDKIVSKADNYRSILDLYPYISTLDCRLDTQLNEKLKFSIDSGHTAFPLLVRNQWGKFTSLCEVQWVPLLTLINGKLIGWSIWKQYKEKHENLNENSFIRLLGLLRRKSIVNFRSEPLNSTLS